jgi:GTPase SAR1 family protein
MARAIEQLEFNIVIMGSPRVGKSQLINALSGGKELAATSTSLNSCTKYIEKYVLETNEGETSEIPSSKVNFYDTPGVESWVDDAGKQSMLDFIEQTDPVCVLYCASPGSFADLSQVRFVLRKCKEKHIVCALLCTNMWDGNRAEDIIQEFEKALVIFGSSIEKYSNQFNSSIRHKVTFFGNGALCTMVNSKEYYNLNWSPIPKGVQGVDELIHGIMELLDEKKILGWCMAVLNRRSFWEKIRDNTNGFFQSRLNDVKNIKKETVVSTALLVAKIAFKWYIK